MRNLTSIYTLSCPYTGMVRYVGKSNNPKKRFERHCDTAQKETSHKFSWILGLAKNNKKPILEIIDDVPFCDWKFWEQHYILLYKSSGAKLVNSTSGGDGGLSLELRQKLSDKLKGKGFCPPEKREHATKVLMDYVANNEPWNKGKKYSLYLTSEEKEKRSKAQIGKHGGKPVLQYDLDGNFIKEWKSAYNIFKETGISFKNISASCIKKNRMNSFLWRFKVGDEIPLKIELK